MVINMKEVLRFDESELFELGIFILSPNCLIEVVGTGASGTK